MTIWIRPMLAKPAENAGVLRDPAFTVEPKLDGQRGQIHVVGGQTVAVFSRSGRSMLGDAGMRWIRTVAWPMADAILDGEVYAAGGLNLSAPSVQSNRASGAQELSVGLFDLLRLDSLDVMPLPQRERRSALARLGLEAFDARIKLVPWGTDGPTMWQAWVIEQGGEGLVFKRPEAPYLAGKRSDAWLKIRKEETIDVVITGVTTKPTYTQGFRSGEAALTYGYAIDGGFETVGQGVKFGTVEELQPYVGKVAEMRCGGQMPSGALRFHQLVRFRDDKLPGECRRAA